MSFCNTVQENSQQDLMVVVYIDRNSRKEAKIKLIFLLFCLIVLTSLSEVPWM